MDALFAIFNPEEISIITRLLIAMILGLTLGAERVFAHKTAGMRTYALVSIGSALFVIISMVASEEFLKVVNFDPMRMAAHIITGIGFLGAGLIIVQNQQVHGLTTAAGLWVAAGIGIATGFGLFAIAITATVLTLFVFTIIWFVERNIKKVSNRWTEGEL